MIESLESLVAVMVVVAAAPLVVAFLPGRVPQVVLLIAGGVVIGPEIADLAKPDDIELFSNLGLGFLFLLAGYELDPALLRERAGRLATIAWGITIVLAGVRGGELELRCHAVAFLTV
jgi:Kef-type K+ transport system membrane component KefB